MGISVQYDIICKGRIGSSATIRGGVYTIGNFQQRLVFDLFLLFVIKFDTNGHQKLLKTFLLQELFFSLSLLFRNQPIMKLWGNRRSYELPPDDNHEFSKTKTKVLSKIKSSFVRVALENAIMIS